MENYKLLLLLLLLSFFLFILHLFSRFRIVDSVGWNENFSEEEKNTEAERYCCRQRRRRRRHSRSCHHMVCAQCACENTWYS